MPPKRLRTAAGSSSTAGISERAPKRSKLAKEHNISAQQETEIREAFALFAEPQKGEKDGVLPVSDVRRAMIALGIPPSTQEELADFLGVLDPEDEGFTTIEPFVAICALKLHQKQDDEDADELAREIDEAFGLFISPPAANSSSSSNKRQQTGESFNDSAGFRDSSGHAGFERSLVVGRETSFASVGSQGSATGAAQKITLAHLRRIANILKEDVDDALLKDMILEANGGAGVGRGVGREEFEGVMRKAGVWR